MLIFHNKVSFLLNCCPLVLAVAIFRVQMSLVMTKKLAIWFDNMKEQVLKYTIFLEKIPDRISNISKNKNLLFHLQDL